jgi:hypothetical protein
VSKVLRDTKPALMNHYTNKKGFNAIRANSPWRFRARRQRNKNPLGAYFTTLNPFDPDFYELTRLPVM